MSHIIIVLGFNMPLIPGLLVELFSDLAVNLGFTGRLFSFWSLTWISQPVTASMNACSRNLTGVSQEALHGLGVGMIEFPGGERLVCLR
jgi:hypothetical protein